jgi:hypothetical protein
MADVGIDDDFIKQVREKVTEGTSALFALTRSHLINGKEGDRSDFASPEGGVFSPFSRADAF